MKLRFSAEHLSITNFDEVQLHDFSVLTGQNGSGKTQLLDAIFWKKVVVDEGHVQKIVRFSPETFRLENEQQHTSSTIVAEKEQGWNMFFSTPIKNNLISFRQLAEQSDPNWLAHRENTAPLWSLASPPGSSLAQYKSNLEQYFNNPNQIQERVVANSLLDLAKRTSGPIDELDRKAFLAQYKHLEHSSDFLPKALGRFIWDYYVKEYKNRFNRYENETQGRSWQTWTDAEFIEVNGERPWEKLNEILNTFGNFDFKFDSPEGIDIDGTYVLNLRHTKNEALIIPFSSLSSGERVLMALAAAVFKANAEKNFPDLLLLDEIDASLHPSMIRNLLNVLKQVFVEKGIKVIMVTHSPTTVALAPEDTIYLVEKSGPQRIVKSTNERALSVLSEGYATLQEGMLIFDEIAHCNVSLISEGRNTKYIRQAIQLFGLRGVQVIEGAESVSSSSQLKVLFDFLSKVGHKNKVFFIWDWDVPFNGKLEGNDQTIPYFFDRNINNTIAEKGIENLFSEELFKGFLSKTETSLGEMKTKFDPSRKRDFEKFILNTACLSDFTNFLPLCNLIRSAL